MENSNKLALYSLYGYILKCNVKENFKEYIIDEFQLQCNLA